MAEQILQTCGIMSDNSSLNLFVSKTPIFSSDAIKKHQGCYTLCNLRERWFLVVFDCTSQIMQPFYLCDILFSPIFFIFLSTRNTTSTVEVLQLQYWYGNLETVFKCLPPLFKVALRQQYPSCLSQVSPDGSDLFVDL